VEKELSQRFIDYCTVNNEWRPPLECVVKNNGGRITVDISNNVILLK